MRIILTLLLATVITTTVLGQDARPQRGQWGPQHQQLTEKQQEATGVTPELIRLSVGLEDLRDLKTDLEQAFLA